MFIIFPYCSFKCDKEAGTQVCQNMALAKEPIIDYPVENIVENYLNNPITSSIVLGGLEPFDSEEELFKLVAAVRKKTNDDIVIYTGYNKSEIKDKINRLKKFKNIIVKFGRFIPNRESRYDEILGVTLSSDNQYAEKIEGE